MNIIEIENIEKKLEPLIRKTGLIKTSFYDKCNLYIKPENLQITGSFKVRGAFNKVSNLTEEEKKKGVIACSSGNHAQGVALACKMMGVEALICMPKNTPTIKVENTKALGAKVELVEGAYDDAYERALELKEEYDYTFVHPFNDEDVVKGQGTIAYEILNELKDTDVIVVPIGGGGLISGIASVAKTIKPDIKVYGVQALGAPSMYASIASGYITKLNKVKTFADGIAVKEVGNITFDYVKQYVDDVLTVDDEDILAAIKVMMSKEKIISEGAGAVGVAAVLKGIVPGLTKESKVVCVVSGGNIDIDMLSKIVMDGLD